MRRLLVLVSTTFLVFSAPSISTASQSEVRILWGNLSRPWTLNLVEQEIKKPLHTQDPLNTAATVNVTDLTRQPGFNPFFITSGDFDIENSRPYAGDPIGPVPSISPQDANWFTNAARNSELPDVYVVAGHQVISEGWHNESEKMFINLPTLLQTLNQYPAARAYFDHIKLAVLWGCNTMTDLEPHGPHGEYLSPVEIKRIYDSGPAGKRFVIGSADEVNTLEFYRARLAREYGPGSPKYEYTRSASKEKCTGPGKYVNCAITNLDRILPDSYLWDGSHFYNYPYMMKRLFPKASLVLGYSSASPTEEERVQIFKDAIAKTYADLNSQLKPKKINNILYPLIEESSPQELRVMIIKALRKNWTISSDSMNRGRPSGSVTPLFPEIDADGVLGAPLNHKSNQYGPYEPR